MDPSLFIDWCKKDTCGSQPQLSCAAIEAYARDCASAGFCIHWRNEYCPAKSCPPDQFYDPCGTSSPKTCDLIKQKVKRSLKKTIPTEGCYCPEGKVLLNSTCVVPKDCEVCDDEGHHPGDTWKKDKCTTCRCEGTSMKCDTEHCPGLSTVCQRGFNAIKVPSAEEKCCDNYVCGKILSCLLFNIILNLFPGDLNQCESKKIYYFKHVIIYLYTSLSFPRMINRKFDNQL